MKPFNSFDYISLYSNIDFEKINNYGYINNFIDNTEVSPFFKQSEINIDKDFSEPSIDISPYIENIMNNNLKENSKESNFIPVGNSTKIGILNENLKINELPNELSSSNIKDILNDSHSSNSDDIINSGIFEIGQNSRILPYKNEKIFRVVFSNDFSIFNYGKYDDYSYEMIYEVLNEPNKKDKEIRKKVLKFFTENEKRPKKKKKYIKKRKQNSDNIRKKIKARFLKSLKNVINQKLEKAGSKYFFSFFPQVLITDLSIKSNKAILNLTLRQIYSEKVCYGKKLNGPNLNKYNHNLFVLNYLENNKDIKEKSNFNAIKNSKLSEIYKEYLLSKEFGMSISTLKKEKESTKYIKDYIIKAKNFLNFFSR